MEITEFTANAAEKFREAKKAWYDLDMHTATRREIEHVERAYQLAAEACASELLADIDKAKGAS